MVADSRPSRWRVWHKLTNCRSYTKKVNQFSWLAFQCGTFPACAAFLLFLLLTSFATAAETPDSSRRTFIHGLIATAQGQPVARATVELRDLRGIKMAVGSTDDNGRFALTTTANPGQYILLITKDLQISDERITVDQGDREVAIALPVTSGSAAVKLQQTYTVSTQQLRVPEKGARAFEVGAAGVQWIESFRSRKGDRPGIADRFDVRRCIFHAGCAARLAAWDPKRAIEDATRVLAIDSDDVEAYLALATAYNSLSEFQTGERAAAQRKLSEGNPDFWQGRLELAKALYGEGQFTFLALRELDELSNDFPDVHLVRANILIPASTAVKQRKSSANSSGKRRMILEASKSNASSPTRHSGQQRYRPSNHG